MNLFSKYNLYYLVPIYLAFYQTVFQYGCPVGMRCFIRKFFRTVRYNINKIICSEFV